MKTNPIRELRKCLGCPRYFWTVSISTEAGTDNWSERLRYCLDCWNNKMQKPMSLKEIEDGNKEIEEDDPKYRRFKAN
jgi:hypothetical protein